MDFLQEEITTIHNFCLDTEKMEQKMVDLTVTRPVTLVLPILYKEIKNDPLYDIVLNLNRCSFIKKIIIPLAAETGEEYTEVIDFFKFLEVPHIVIWCNGPRIEAIIDDMKEKDLDITSFKGKGRDVWIAIGVASLNSYAIAFHDADIVNYSKSHPVRLLYPIVDPELDFFFNKGYYARIGIDTKIMYGRVYRLFVRPLIEALRVEVGYNSSILQYMQAFRYLLSGEFAMTTDMAINIRIPGDWGLEVGILAEIYRNTTPKRICQIDLDFYEHKHQKLGQSSQEGLCKMAHDILTTFLRVITESTNGSCREISGPFLHSVTVKYKRMAQDLIRQYHADALCNGISYNRHKEERYVDIFADIIMSGGEQYLEEPENVLLPDWKRALSAIPNIRTKIQEAALEDMNEYKSNSNNL
ncbi:glucosyl-3-phosphoglycerate synthase [Methanosalsum natronophilum]|uniref:glucosyl-3-phosphoglycerate synthase n=1 Tax=Methanosalsum natronophilum TaxID=768733 RepID=UPI002168D721|nr:glucosyl-3-phosphoglycerate synthase [Methanosalsum natronophilum]MCS3923301.1 glucosyl-3-phosphoglycerate synthase [Methanosalsum natronophilum]